MKKQIILIHGGETFDRYEDYLDSLSRTPFDPFEKKEKFWKDNFSEDLGEGYEVFTPKMPSKSNAKYDAWRIWFEKLIPFLRDGGIFVGHSLGAIFLAKYFSENKLPIKVQAVYLLAGPFWKKGAMDAGGFELPENLELFQKQCEQIFLYHSEDDPVVLFTDMEKYATSLPSATRVRFTDRNHFHIKRFPELVESIKNI
jgi:predicted alpha/beta hydrolase family esterase